MAQAGLADTLAMSIAGTALAVASRCCRRIARRTEHDAQSIVYRVARLILNLLRSIPGTDHGDHPRRGHGRPRRAARRAGARHPISIGTVGALAESIEHVDPKPIEAAYAAGASPFQVIWHAGLHRVVMPQLADTTIHRWEYNFRASTVLGAVGAGGIGFELIAACGSSTMRRSSAPLICTFPCR